MDLDLEMVAREVLGKTTYMGIPAKNQLALFKLLLDKVGNFVGNKDIAAKLKEIGVFSGGMDSDVARRQVLKAVKILEQKLQLYASGMDSKPQYCYILEKGQGGSAVRLISASEATANYAIQPVTFGIHHGMVKLSQHYSASTGKSMDEIVYEALKMMILSNQNYLQDMKDKKNTYPLGYKSIGGMYLDDLKRVPKKK